MDQALLERALQLGADERRELIACLQDSLNGSRELPAETAALIDERLADADANPDAFVSLDDDEREVRARRHAA